MKAYSAIILLCFLQTLMCDAVLNTTALLQTFNTSLKHLKAFRPASIPVKGVKKAGPSFNLKGLTLAYAGLTGKDASFKKDDFGLLHVKYSNLKLTLKGTYPTTGQRKLKFANPFTASLSNANFELIYGVTSKDLTNGKHEFKFTFKNETAVNFKLSKFTTVGKKTNTTSASEAAAKLQINKVDFAPLKAHFKKVTQIVFERFNAKIKKSK